MKKEQAGEQINSFSNILMAIYWDVIMTTQNKTFIFGLILRSFCDSMINKQHMILSWWYRSMM